MIKKTKEAFDMNEYENNNMNNVPEEETPSAKQNDTYTAPEAKAPATEPEQKKTYYYTAPNATSNNIYGGAYNVASDERPVKPKTDGFGIASFCVALSFIFIGCCCWCCIPDLVLILPIVAFLAEIAALVFAFVSRKQMGKFTGFAIAGLVISIIMIALYLAVVITVVGVLLANPSILYDFSLIAENESAYVDFFEKYAPEFYAENKEMIDDIFKDAFEEASGLQ